MVITDDLSTFHAFEASPNQVLGYHSSVRSACAAIEELGFLPNKIFPLEDHNALIKMAAAYQVDSSDLQTWLAMRSVTFTRRPDEAIYHIQQGSAGGQGLKNLTAIIKELSPKVSGQERTFVDCLKSKIEEVRADQPVTYIVDLSNLGPRLDPDRVQPFYYYRWHPDKEFPMVSELGPDRILVKLIHK